MVAIRVRDILRASIFFFGTNFCSYATKSNLHKASRIKQTARLINILMAQLIITNVDVVNPSGVDQVHKP